MPTPTVENYLKLVYLEQLALGDCCPSDEPPLVPMGRLATGMNVVPGTATSMAKSLAGDGLLDYEPRGGVRLTPTGRAVALRVLRRHRLIERFLVDVLKLDWSEVHPEAEELEHAVSDKVLERIDALLGRPSVDPHGDPIPSHEGAIADAPLPTLADTPTGTRGRVARVLDQSPDFLRFVERSGLTPGAQVTVASRDPSADAVTVRVGNDAPAPMTPGSAAEMTLGSAAEMTLGSAAAGKIMLDV